MRGWLNFQPNHPDNTNTVYLSESLLGPYVGRSLGVWKCPGDKSMVRNGGVLRPRVRSIGMSSWLGPDRSLVGAQYWVLPQYKQMFKAADLDSPQGPAKTWVMLDEREDSINNGFFVVSMQGFDPARGNNPGAEWIDWPAYYHGRAGSFLFQVLGLAFISED